MFDRKKFKAAIVLAGKRTSDVANMLDIDESTLHRKVANNGNFTRSEIEKMVEYLAIKEPNEIFFAKSLA